MTDVPLWFWAGAGLALASTVSPRLFWLGYTALGALIVGGFVWG